MAEKVHHGRAVKRIRELLHVKQDALAIDLGISQQSVSLLENKETIDPETLEQVAKILKVPVEAIKNFNEEAQVFNIQHNYEGSNTGANSAAFNNQHCTFNAMDKWLESLEEIKKITEINKELYERLVQAEKEKVSLLETMLKQKK